MNFDHYFTDICFYEPEWQFPSIGSVNGLAPTGLQDIIWTSVGKFKPNCINHRFGLIYVQN